MATRYGQNGELLDRLTSISYPDGGLTTYSYSTACGQPTTTTIALGGGSNYTETATLDGLCHVTQTAVTSDSQPDYTDTTYTGLGQVYTVSNPHRTTPSTSDGVTTTYYDPLGRVSSVAYPDGSTSSTNYSASSNKECSQLSDPAGVSRTLCSDAMGRLLQVTENGLSATTTYGHDGLDDLVSVNQSGLSRSFNYDSLGRMTSASNPEANVGGTQCPTTYTYDANGNLTSRVAPLENQNASCGSTTTTYAYDALNRVTSKTYSDGTPAASFFYDQAPSSWPGWSGVSFGNAVGRLTVACTGSQPGTCASPQTAVAYSYDPMGRTSYYWQFNPDNCPNSSICEMAYNYDQAGDVISWTHPAGYTITQTINGAREVSQITSSWSGSGPPTLANVTYTPFGSVSTLQNGCVGTGCTNPLETYTYNNRLQPWMIQLGNSSNTFASFCLVYNYFTSWTAPTSCPNPSSVPTSGSGNNGNVRGYDRLDYYDPSYSYAEAYQYDGANRLTYAAATPEQGSSAHYSATYQYDVFGNMWCTASTNGAPCPQSTYNGNNQITSYSYDAAGNVTNDGAHTYQWNAERRLASVDGGNTETYTYNALGQEVRLYAPSQYTWDHLYDPSGAWIGRWSNNSWQVPGVFHLGGRPFAVYIDQAYSIHVNALGTTTMDANAAGNVVGDMAVYPWGQPWLGGSPEWHYAAFEYGDSATGLYPTLNRQYSTLPARWMSPDPDNAGADPSDPQTWNMYAYVGNNPTSLIDPTGLRSVDCQSDAKTCMNRNPFSNGNGGCEIDGVAASCNFAFQLLGSGSAILCPNNNCNDLRAVMGPGGSTVWQQWVPPTSSQNGDVIKLAIGYWATVEVDDVVEPLVESAEGALLNAGKGIIGVGSVLAAPLLILMNAGDLNPVDDVALINALAEHTKGARPSTKGKHEEGLRRKKADRGGRKGYWHEPRRRPDNWRGPWPPKP